MPQAILQMNWTPFSVRWMLMRFSAILHPGASKNFFEKRNDEIYALSLPFKNFKLGFPTALSKGLYNYTTINRLTENVRHIRDFNKLPIPFVCIATDIETGKEVVLHKGILPDAILASGAFPIAVLSCRNRRKPADRWRGNRQLPY